MFKIKKGPGPFFALICLFGWVSLCLADSPPEKNNQGIIKEYYLNNKLKAEYSYKDGKLEGVCREYYESGPVASARQYRDGKRDGYSRIFYENGQMQFEGIYKAGKYLSGVEFDDNGQPLKGTVKEYYPGGKLWSETNYAGGKPDGINKVYYENGVVKSEVKYKQGGLLVEKEFDQNGKMISEKNH